MSKIKFTLINHPENSRPSVIDIVAPIACGLQELGHAVSISTDVQEDCDLIIFTEHFYPEIVKDIAKLKNKYAVIQSELLTNDTFNNHVNFRGRLGGFREVCKKAEFVIYLVGETDVACPAFKCELGYSPHMRVSSDDQNKYDLCFFGTFSQRRLDLCNEIGTRGYSVCYCSDVSTKDRNKALSQSRWNLGLKPHWNVEFASITRINAALHCGTPTLYEHVKPGSRIESIPLTHNGEGSFIDWIADKLGDKDLWERERKRQLSEFHKIRIADILKSGFESIGYKL